MKRRQLIQMMGLSVPTVLLAGSWTHAQEACSESGIIIGTNHGHDLEIPVSKLVEVLVSGEKQTLTMSGSHSHDVEISAVQAERIIAEERVELVATGAGHTHSVTVQMESLKS